MKTNLIMLNKRMEKLIPNGSAQSFFRPWFIINLLNI
jgi:hypothetical protein